MFDCWWTRFGYNEFLCWLKWRLTLSTSCVFFSSGPSIGAVEFCMPVPGFWGKPRWNFSTDSDSCVLRVQIDVVRNKKYIGIGFEKTHFLVFLLTHCFWHKFMQPCSQSPGNASQLRLVWRCHLLNHGFPQFFRLVKQRNGRGKSTKRVFMLSLMVLNGAGFYNWMIGILNIFFIIGWLEYFGAIWVVVWIKKLIQIQQKRGDFLNELTEALRMCFLFVFK